MRLGEKIKLDIKKSMIGRHTERATLLRTLSGEIDRDFRNKNKDISDTDVISIIKKMKENAISMSNDGEVKIELSSVCSHCVEPVCQEFCATDAIKIIFTEYSSLSL